MICDRCRRAPGSIKEARGYRKLVAEEFDRGKLLAEALKRGERPAPAWTRWVCAACFARIAETVGGTEGGEKYERICESQEAEQKDL